MSMMNSFSETAPDQDPLPANPPTAPKGLIPDDEFEGEELGERQAGVCSLEEGCTVCQ